MLCSRRGDRQQAVANTAAQQQKGRRTKSGQCQKLDTFRLSFGACMDARGYSVK